MHHRDLKACRICPYLRREVSVCGTELARLRTGKDERPISVAVAVVASLAIAASGNLIVLAGRAHGVEHWFTLVGVPVVAIVGGLLLASRWTPTELGLRRPVLTGERLPTTLFLTAAVLAVLLIVAYLARWDARTNVALARLVIGTAVGEEAVHRGVVLACWASTRLRARYVVLANAAVFGAWHIAGAIPDTGFKPLEVIGPTAGAFLLLWARLRFRSLLAPVAGHACTNLLEVPT
jgi:membrane protease YdiL (CAAX protease family)